jgi:hypothetical protein
VLDSESYFRLVSMVMVSAPAWPSFQPPMLLLQRTSVANSLLRAAVTLEQSGSSQPGSARSRTLNEQLRAVEALLGISAAASSRNRVGGNAFRQAVAVPGLAGFLQRHLASLAKAGALDAEEYGNSPYAVALALRLAWEVERAGGGLGAEGGPLGAADRERMMLPQLLGQLDAAAATREGGGVAVGPPFVLILQQCRQLLGLEPMPAAAEQEEPVEEGEWPAGAAVGSTEVWRLDEARPLAEKHCAHCQATASALEASRRKLQLCSGCRAILYCSGDCQRSHWRAHKAECRRVQEEARRVAAA